MTYNPWVKIDEKRNEYCGIDDFLSNYRRPTFPDFSISRGRRLYVIEFYGRVKIGVSRNPRERICCLKEPLMYKIFVSCHACHYGDERSLHEKYSDHNAYGEYFFVPYDKIMRTIKADYSHLLRI